MSTVHPPKAGTFDEMLQADASPRPPYRGYHPWLARIAEQELRAKRSEAELLFQRVGITFALGGDDEGTERLIPFDFVPRIIP
ncbi:MAG: circularly permuted type 2 ATP-grasp protein, partial [Gammaproteobacteria bacterium]